MRFTIITTLVLATLAYAAPEASENGMSRIARSDIFPRQFGCVSTPSAQHPSVQPSQQKNQTADSPHRTAVKAAAAPTVPPAAPTAAALV